VAKPTVTEIHLKRAREIAQAHWPFVGKGGSLAENVARTIAQGIAEGRQQQGFELAKKARE
jgi:thiamine monophosphate synthase